MKKKSLKLIILGLLGIIFICTFDFIAGKPINDITGPKSISGLVLCAFLILWGIVLLKKNSKKSND